MGSDYLIHIHGGNGEIGVAATGGNFEGYELGDIVQRVYGSLLDLLDIAIAFVAAGYTCDTGKLGKGMLDTTCKLEIGPFLDENAQAPGNTHHGCNREAFEHSLDIAQKAHFEDFPIVAFQADFVIMDQTDPLELRHRIFSHS